jgi:hypothetical protein
MAGKTGATCSPAAPLSRPANARRRARRAAQPAERAGKHKRSTRGAQEEHKRPTRYLSAITWLAPRPGVALGGLPSRPADYSTLHIPHSELIQRWHCPAFQVSYLIPTPALCLRPRVASDAHCAVCNMIVPHRIPKGFRLKAQGCEQRATLGWPCEIPRQPQRGCGPRALCPRPQPRRD